MHCSAWFYGIALDLCGGITTVALMVSWRKVVTMRFLGTITMLVFALLMFSATSALAECVTSTCHADLDKAASVHDPVSGGECESCHEATGLPHPGKDLGFFFPELGNDLCLMCHDDPVAGQAHIHPALEDGCTACHNPHSGPAEMMLPAAGSDLCYECHDNKTEGKKHVHSAIEDGCISCHNPHAGPAEKMLPAAGADLCYECHDNKAEEKFVHGPVDAGECSICHDPHATDAEYQLAEEGATLCLMCHSDKEEMLNGEHVHPIVADGCANCHSPHSGPEEYMLPEAGDALCFMCHDDIPDAMQARFPHDALEDGCATCHDAHGTGEMKMFVMEAETLCYACHDDKELEFTAFKSQHQPVADGECWGCHAPHGANRKLLLKGNWPDKFYQPYSAETYSLCLNCHGKNKFEYARTSEATDFRNGDRNLHYLHVNKEKGRVCKVCHGVHGAQQENLILDKVPGFGKWQIPVEHTATATGGACLAGCHKPMYYDRDQRVLNR
jgi:predicted CXXCH cytochrome family protein